MKGAGLLCVAGAGGSAIFFSTGCTRAPSFDILGSFFPIWIFCIAVGILLTALARRIFVRFKIDSLLGPVLIIYPCLTAFFAFTLWLIFFR